MIQVLEIVIIREEVGLNIVIIREEVGILTKSFKNGQFRFYKKLGGLIRHQYPLH